VKEAAVKGLRRKMLAGAAVAAARLLMARGLEAETAIGMVPRKGPATAAVKARAVRVDRGRPVATAAVLRAAAQALLALEVTGTPRAAVEAAGITALAVIAPMGAVLAVAAATMAPVLLVAAKGNTVQAVAALAMGPVAATEDGRGAHLEMGLTEEETELTVTARLVVCPRVVLRGLLNRFHFCQPR